MSGPGAISVRGLGVAFGAAPVLDRVDLEVEAGTFTCVVGPSGCGKSTLLRVLAGLQLPTSGTVAIDGRDVAGRPGSCAWQPQRDDLLPWRTVLGNATLGAEVAGTPAAVAAGEARALLERFGLGAVADAWPTELSGGMRQRVAVLRAFLTPAPVLLLDEPFGALDALTRRQMQGWLQEVWSADEPGTRRSVLLVTHDVEEALLLGDRVLVMASDGGRFVVDQEVTHPRPRSASLVAEPGFVAERARLFGALGA